jgi:hypothetical protein
MSAQQSASTHHPPHLQDLAAAHHIQHRPQNRRQRHDGQPDFIMTGARIGNINGGIQPGSAESSVCSDQGGGISMAPPLRQTQRYKASRRNEGGGFNGRQIPTSLIKEMNRLLTAPLFSRAGRYSNEKSGAPPTSNSDFRHE